MKTDAKAESADLRTAMIVAGAGLVLMALIAPIGLLTALPSGETGIAAMAVLTIAALDVVVAVSLLPLLTRGGMLLARIAVAARLVYAAAFAGAAGFLLDPADPVRFQTIWDGALLVFGLHLVLAGVALWRTRITPIWIAVLVIAAGTGYLVDALAIVLGLGISIGEFTFVGEPLLAVWLIARGIRPARRRSQLW